MKKRIITIKRDELKELAGAERTPFPKYAESLINLASRISQALRPKYVGQMTELIKECPHKDYDGWRKWYLAKHPQDIEKATKMIMGMLENLHDATSEVLKNKDLVRAWVEDVVLVRTFIGLRVQEPILKKVSQVLEKRYRNSTPYEESQGIDGFIGSMSISVKPKGYRTNGRHNGISAQKFIFYEVEESGDIVVDFSSLEE